MLKESRTEPSLALTIRFIASLDIEIFSFFAISSKKEKSVFLSMRLKSKR